MTTSRVDLNRKIRAKQSRLNEKMFLKNVLLQANGRRVSVPLFPFLAEKPPVRKRRKVRSPVTVSLYHRLLQLRCSLRTGKLFPLFSSLFALTASASRPHKYRKHTPLKAATGLLLTGGSHSRRDVFTVTAAFQPIALCLFIPSP